MDDELSPLQARLMATYMEALNESKLPPSKPPAQASPAPAPSQPQPSPTRTRSDLYSKKMGELLLKGWRMLAENCPVTGEVPLMQDPTSGRKFSIALSKFIDEGDEKGAEAEATTAAAPSPAAVPTPAPPRRADVLPSPSQPDSPPKPAPAPASSRPRLPPVPAESEQAREQRTSESDRWCEHMSQLMLKSWKMLDEHCPVTGQVPLMEHPTNGRKFSVATGKFLDEMLAAAATAPEPAPAAAAKASAAPPTVAKASAAPAIASAPSPAPKMPPAAPVAVPSAVAPVSKLAPISSVPGSETRHAAAIDAAAAAVENQLLQCSALLAEATSPPPLPLLEAVTRCAQALSALEEARRAASI